MTGGCQPYFRYTIKWSNPRHNNGKGAPDCLQCLLFQSKLQILWLAVHHLSLLHIPPQTEGLPGVWIRGEGWGSQGQTRDWMWMDTRPIWSPWILSHMATRQWKCQTIQNIEMNSLWHLFVISKYFCWTFDEPKCLSNNNAVFAELKRQTIGRVSLIGSITPTLGLMPTNSLTKEAIYVLKLPTVTVCGSQ